MESQYNKALESGDYCTKFVLAMYGRGSNASLLSLSLSFSVFKDTKDGAKDGSGANTQVSGASLYAIRRTGAERSATRRSSPYVAQAKS